MRTISWLPVLALLCGCATDAPLTGGAPVTGSVPVTGSMPETPISSATLPPDALAPLAAPPASAPATAIAPVALSRAQTGAIEDALWRVLDDPAWVRLGPVSAGVGRDGITVVCGTLKSRNSFGVYSKVIPFRGEFRGKEFKTAPVGSAVAVSTTLAACEKAGLPINVLGS